MSLADIVRTIAPLPGQHRTPRRLKPERAARRARDKELREQRKAFLKTLTEKELDRVVGW